MQGGYLSMQEAGYHGVPVVGIPLTLGQGELVQHAADHGRGLLVPKEGLMSGDGRQLADALLEVVSNSSYKRQVRRLFEKWTHGQSCVQVMIEMATWS